MIVAQDKQIGLLPEEPIRYPPCMDHDDTAPYPIPAGWLEVMAESDAQLAAGRIVPASVVLAELRASIAQLEAAQSAGADEAAGGQRESGQADAPFLSPPRPR